MCSFLNICHCKPYSCSAYRRVWKHDNNFKIAVLITFIDEERTGKKKLIPIEKRNNDTAMYNTINAMLVGWFYDYWNN